MAAEQARVMQEYMQRKQEAQKNQGMIKIHNVGIYRWIPKCFGSKYSKKTIALQITAQALLS